MSNRIWQVPRSIKFSEKGFKNFVKGSSFLNINPNFSNPSKQNYQQNNNYNNNRILANTDRNVNQNFKLLGFDFYNKNNLLLKACNVQDLQYVTKNPIVFEEDVLIMPDKQHPQSSKNIPNGKLFQNQEYNKKIKTMKDFYKPKMAQIQQDQNIKASKEAQLNEFLFNYRKKQQEKKNKKLKFIEQMQRKINNLEKQAVSLQDQKVKQYQQINGILKISNDTAQYAKRADMLGKVNTALYQIQSQSKHVSPPKRITEDMELLQINLAIQQHHEYNDALLDQIQRVSRSKSKQKLKINQKFNEDSIPKKVLGKKTNDFDSQPQSVLSKTKKRPIQAPPRPVSAKKNLTSTQKGKKI